jgi:hypothetical protein
LYPVIEALPVSRSPARPKKEARSMTLWLHSALRISNAPERLPGAVIRRHLAGVGAFCRLGYDEGLIGT